MGAVFRPRDLTKGRKRVIENMLKDIHPDVVEEVVGLLRSWDETSPSYEEKLKELIGQEKARSLLDLTERKKNTKR